MPEFISVLEDKRRQNIEMVLKKLKFSNDTIIQAILYCK